MWVRQCFDVVGVSFVIFVLVWVEGVVVGSFISKLIVFCGVWSGVFVCIDAFGFLGVCSCNLVG